jgi:hypothetical protein
MELTSAPGIGCFVPQLPLDPPDVTVSCGTCGLCVRNWWRRRESKSQEHLFRNPLMACDFWSKCLLEKRLPAVFRVRPRSPWSSQIDPGCGDIVESVP